MRQRRGWEHVNSRGIDDLIAGLTSVDELPPKGLLLDAQLAATTDSRRPDCGADGTSFNGELIIRGHASLDLSHFP